MRVGRGRGGVAAWRAVVTCHGECPGGRGRCDVAMTRHGRYRNSWPPSREPPPPSPTHLRFLWSSGGEVGSGVISSASCGGAIEFKTWVRRRVEVHRHARGPRRQSVKALGRNACGRCAPPVPWPHHAANAPRLMPASLSETLNYVMILGQDTAPRAAPSLQHRSSHSRAPEQVLRAGSGRGGRRGAAPPLRRWRN